MNTTVCGISLKPSTYTTATEKPAPTLLLPETLAGYNERINLLVEENKCFVIEIWHPTQKWCLTMNLT